MVWDPMRFESQMPSSVSARSPLPVGMTTVKLARTDEPVWREDEDLERDQRRAAGLDPIVLLAGREADEAVRSVRVALPDIVLPRPPNDGAAGELPGRLAGLEPCQAAIPFSFDAPEGMVLRRLLLSVRVEAPERAVVLGMRPPSSVQSSTSRVLEGGVDLGKVVSLLFPSFPPVFTAKAEGGVDVTKVRPVVLASGVLTRECTWRVSDSEIAYLIAPSLVVGVPDGEGLTLSAELHVEIRRRILGVFHKTYAKSALPHVYELTPTSEGLEPAGPRWEPPSAGHLSGERAMAESGQAVPGGHGAGVPAAPTAGDSAEVTLTLSDVIEDMDQADEAIRRDPAAYARYRAELAAQGRLFEGAVADTLPSLVHAASGKQDQSSGDRAAISELEQIVARLRILRSELGGARDKKDPTYRALSKALTNLHKAIDEMKSEM